MTSRPLIDTILLNVAPERTNRFWIQPTFNGVYDSGVFGPGGIEVFGQDVWSVNDDLVPPPSFPPIYGSIEERIITHDLHYIYATNSSYWNLDFLLTARNNNTNLQYAEYFKFDRAWFTIKTIY